MIVYTLNTASGWLAQNGLGLATLVVAVVAAVAAVWQLLVSRVDVDLHVAFVGDAGELIGHRAVNKIRQYGDAAVPVDVQFAVVNVGGNKSARGILTITAWPMFELLPSARWKADTPNALMWHGSEAMACKLPRIGRNERYITPPLTICPRKRELTGGTGGAKGKLRWEAWSGRGKRRRGANSDNLTLEILVTRPPTPS